MHTESSPLAGQTVTLKNDIKTTVGLIPAGTQARVEDWWDYLTGKSWGMSDGNPACLIYAIRIGVQMDPPIPSDDEVLYVKIRASDSSIELGHLVHMVEVQP